MYPLLPKAVMNERVRSRFTDIVILGVGIAVLYGVLSVARTWLKPFTPEVEISLSPWKLPVYAGFSLARIAISYVISLVFAIGYGYLAAYNAKAERILLPLLDILQSIPVLSFLPGVMLAMIALFPSSQVGVELGSVILIFTGQVWNIAFSFYSSVKSIPRELYEASAINRFSLWQRFTQLELPYSAIGLVWNSMMSVAGAWFFLMVCEMGALGTRQFKLPGIGSYIQTAANDGDLSAIVAGLIAMIAVIVLLDQLVWRPVIAWSDKFKFEEVENADAPGSAVLDLLRRSNALAFVSRKAFQPLSERITLLLAHRMLRVKDHSAQSAVGRKWVMRILAAAILILAAYGAFQALLLVTGITADNVREIFVGAAATFLRVAFALIIGAAWAIPAGVAIGSNPRLARIAQPLAQIAASVPATGLFPVVLLILIRAGMVKGGGGLGVASLLLMLLGTQWYILFNVIAGAMAIPTNLKEAASVFKFGTVARWKMLILPGIFPYLITGMVTAAGGAWNASIVAEYMSFQDHVLSTTGLGATINQASTLASTTGNYGLLLAATSVMALMVVTINRLLWRRMYRLAETRYKLEG